MGLVSIYGLAVVKVSQKGTCRGWTVALFLSTLCPICTGTKRWAVLVTFSVTLSVHTTVVLNLQFCGSVGPYISTATSFFPCVSHTTGSDAGLFMNRSILPPRKWAKLSFTLAEFNQVAYVPMSSFEVIQVSCAGAGVMLSEAAIKGGARIWPWGSISNRLTARNS